MSMYDMMFNRHANAGYLLNVLGLIIPNPDGTRDDYISMVPRFRNCYMVGEEIMVYARIGGGNRADYQDGIDALRANPHYLRDEDGTADSTYAKIYFKVPDEKKEEIMGHLEYLQGPDPDEAWQKAFKTLQGG